ncbi:MAG TPA: hypothetical protein VG963_27930, partial [Polyangiaceae bacterium]|nr:hypothetical protein [Polyangiaceae bacterium]
GLLSEQIWDGDPISERGLFPGEASDSARPLVWAHAEYIKLLRSLCDGAVFDMPTQTVQRYQVERRGSGLAVWRFDARLRQMAAGRTLRLETLGSCRVRWTANAWQTWADTAALDSGLGLFFADLPTATLPAGTHIAFTFYWIDARRWEEHDFEVRVREH